jgi:hypothetical protein
MMPVTDIWSKEYSDDPRPYKLFEHCLINVIAKVGSVLQRIEMADHYGQDYGSALTGQDVQVQQALALSVMSLLKAANAFPDSTLTLGNSIVGDLQRRGVIE